MFRVHTHAISLIQAAVVLLAACSLEEPADQRAASHVAGSGASVQPAGATSPSLRGGSGAFLTRRHPDGRLKVAIGLKIRLPGSSPEAIAGTLVETLGAELGVGGVGALRLVEDEKAERSWRHLRYEQLEAGLPVFDARLALQVKSDMLVELTSSLKVFDALNTDGVIGEEEAWKLLAQAEGVWGGGKKAQEGILETSLGQGERAWRLVGLRQRADGQGEPVVAFVSAVDGRVLKVEGLARDALDVPACTSQSQLECSVTVTAPGADGVSRTIPAYRGIGFTPAPLIDGYLHPYLSPPNLYGTGTSTDTWFVDLSSVSTIGGLYVVHSNGSIYDVNAAYFFDSYDYITSGTSFTDQKVYGASVSAMSGLRKALDFFAREYDQAGVNDVVGSPVSIVSRVDLKGYNASWVPEYNYMFFGSWLGTSLAVAQDVIGHELTHGIIYFTSQLGYADQPGALNEGLADIFGVLLEADVNGKVDWSIGEDLPRSPPVRSLAHPEYYGMPGHMSEYEVTDSDNGGIHQNSAIVSKAFQLAVAGSGGVAYHGYVVPPADADLSTSARLVGKVMYQTLRYRLVPDTDFADFAISALGAADEVGLTSTQLTAVHASLRGAFLATGILTDELGEPLCVVGGVISSSSTGLAVSGASVLITGTGVSFETKSDARGSYLTTVPISAATTLTMTASAPGFYALTRSINAAPLDVAASSQVQADFRLNARPASSIKVSSSSLTLNVTQGSSATVNLTVTNQGSSSSELVYTAAPVVSYSKASAPYVWNDIAVKVSPVAVTGDQGHSGALALSKPFPFFFNHFQSLYVSTDGYVTLTPDPTEMYREYDLPGVAAPLNLIAPFWADLDFGTSEKAYFSYDSSTGVATLQWEDVPDFFQQYRYTFQLALYPDGKIRCYYKRMDGIPQSWARIGLQDGAGEEGYEFYELKYGNTYSGPPAGTAIELVPSILPAPGVVSLGQTSADLFGGQSTIIPVTVSAASLPKGTSSFILRLFTNDPTKPEVRVPVSVTVQ